MIPELGLYSLVLAGCLAFLASVAGLAAESQPNSSSWCCLQPLGNALLRTRLSLPLYGHLLWTTLGGLCS
ncbi:MAG: hypothetical protein CM15mP120_25560 [Pseudomonadota bacterium]|nr:MAG: hypothetical protein CM15mP120_25560 [Pseudomonadota bacterium]